jgi:HK97 family phage prohead protease
MDLDRVNGGGVPILTNHSTLFEGVKGKVIKAEVVGHKLIGLIDVYDKDLADMINSRMEKGSEVGLSVGLGVRFKDVDWDKEKREIVYEKSTLTELSLVATPALTGAKILEKAEENKQPEPTT